MKQRSFSHAQSRKDFVEDVFDPYSARNPLERARGNPQIFRNELGIDAIVAQRALQGRRRLPERQTMSFPCQYSGTCRPELTCRETTDLVKQLLHTLTRDGRDPYPLYCAAIRREGRAA